MNYNMNEEELKVCGKCEKELPKTVEFYFRDKKKVDGLCRECKVCRGSKYGISAINRVLKAKDGYKYCGKCKEELPLDYDHFYRNKNVKSGWRSTCKLCMGIEYGVHQPNKTLKAKEGHHFCSRCKEELPMANFYNNKDNKSGLHSSCKKCEHERDKKHMSCERTREKYREYRKGYRKRYYSTEHGKMINKRNLQRRRARKQGAIYNYPKETWEVTLSKFNDECAYCGSSEDLQQEHIIPMSKEGNYTKQNIIPACSFCNASKKDRDLMDWYPRQSFYEDERLNKIKKWSNIDDNGTQQLSIL